MNEHNGQVRWGQGLAVAAIVMALCTTTAACSPQEEPMMPPFASTLPSIAIPEIDAGAPAYVETATFALG